MTEHSVPPERESEDACSLGAGRVRSEDEVSEAPGNETGAEPLSRLLNVGVRSEYDVRPGGEADPGEGVLACSREEGLLDTPVKVDDDDVRPLAGGTDVRRDQLRKGRRRPGRPGSASNPRGLTSE